MSAEYEIKAGRVVRSRKPLATRGLNRNCNRRLKELFINATVAGSRSEPYRSYVEGLQQKGIRTEMARLTLDHHFDRHLFSIQLEASGSDAIKPGYPSTRSIAV